MTNPKILILGHGRHGKDTVAEILRDDFGLNFVSSSRFVGERIMFDYFDQLPDHPGYEDFEACYADRHNHRAEWHDQIAAYNTPDKSRVSQEILVDNDLYVGMRANDEYQASRHLFDAVIWVDASDRGLPPEGKDSFNIDLHDDMVVIKNDGTLEELKEKVYLFMNSLNDLPTT